MSGCSIRVVVLYDRCMDDDMAWPDPVTGACHVVCLVVVAARRCGGLIGRVVVGDWVCAVAIVARCVVCRSVVWVGQERE